MHHKCDVLFTFCEVFPEVRFYSMKKCTKLAFLGENGKKSELFILITLNEGKNSSLTMQVLLQVLVIRRFSIFDTHIKSSTCGNLRSHVKWIRVNRIHVTRGFPVQIFQFSLIVHSRTLPPTSLLLTNFHQKSRIVLI